MPPKTNIKALKSTLQLNVTCTCISVRCGKM